MRLRKSRVFLLIVAVLLIAQTILSFRYTGKDCCGVEGLRVRTWAPASIVMLRYGLADNRYVNQETNLRSYTYNDVQLFGRKASIEFYISRFRAYWIRATILEDPEGAYREACESIREANKARKGFEIRETADGCEMGSPLGPPFFSMDLSLLDDHLVIDITEQR